MVTLLTWYCREVLPFKYCKQRWLFLNPCRLKKVSDGLSHIIYNINFKLNAS